jgi:UDP-N-acetylmuramate dehydrogenase
MAALTFYICYIGASPISQSWMQLLENVQLKDYTTFKIGGPARYFVVATSVEILREAVSWANENTMPIFILGGGSNVLISDNGFNGLVIKIEIKGITTKIISDIHFEVVVGAGENWDEFVGSMVAQNIFGLENLSSIPGSVGAAPVQNIGAYGVEVRNFVSWVEIFNTQTQLLETLNSDQCHFNYRDSIFKKPEGKKYVITRVAFFLSSVPNVQIEYKDIANYVTEHNITEVTPQKVREMVIDIRAKKLPDLNIYGTAGSFFKNPIIWTSHYKELVQQYPEMPFFATSDEHTVKIPAAWLLDKLCGFKGYREGNAGVYQNQALVLVNYGEASAQDIFSLSEKMIKCVEEKTKIKLEREVQIIF